MPCFILTMDVLKTILFELFLWSFQIAAVVNSTEYRLGLNKNAKMQSMCLVI